MANDDGVEVEHVEVVDEAPFETRGRIDPIYEPAVQQYHAPVAESRSFWSRFWWFLPLLLLLIALPILLHRCGAPVNHIENLAGLNFVIAVQII